MTKQQRKHQRVNVQMMAQINHDGDQHPAMVVNISQGGALIRTDLSMRFGDRFQLQLELPGIPEPSTIPCVTRWCGPDEVGVQFETCRPIEVWALSKLIRQ